MTQAIFAPGATRTPRPNDSLQNKLYFYFYFLFWSLVDTLCLRQVSGWLDIRVFLPGAAFSRRETDNAELGRGGAPGRAPVGSS